MNDLWEAIRDELAGWPIGSGYYATQIAVHEAGEMADAILNMLPGRGEVCHYDENTLAKVYWALGRAGLSDVQITDAINKMQNGGILFRERDE